MEVRRLTGVRDIDGMPKYLLSHWQFVDQHCEGMSTTKDASIVDVVEARVAVGHTEEGFIGQFDVKEPTVRAINTLPNDPVYQDSCVECFLLLGKTKEDNTTNQSDYFNFEFNCIGTLLAARGPTRNQREFLHPDVRAAVKVWTSYPPQIPFEEKPKMQDGSYEWRLTFLIPWHVIGWSKEEYRQHLIHQSQETPTTLLGNFYKCGDRLHTPHWASFFPINTQQPDFHRPDSFQPIKLLP